MSVDKNERLEAEISLLEAMYPDQVKFKSKAGELRFSSESASFTLRLPAGYLKDELPEVISASFGRSDGRQLLKKSISDCPVGEEILDSIINSVDELAESDEIDEPNNHEPSNFKDIHRGNGNGKATVIVWLHHLLNTNKRKQALSPPSSDVSGITKPGYPGVLIYSGPSTGVHEHVNELRQLNWQAFSVRLESDKEWTFQHGTGVKEFETMKEVVADLTEDRKEIFMEAMRMK